MSVRVSADLVLDRSAAFEAIVEEMSIALLRAGMYLRPGADGSVREGGVEVGRVVRWKAPEEIVLEWHAAAWQPGELTSLEMRFEPVDQGTRVTVEDHGMGQSAGGRPGRGAGDAWRPCPRRGPCDCPAWQAARLLSGAAQDAARAWILPVPGPDILDVTWDLRQTFCDLGAALWRLSRFRDTAATGGLPPARLDEPGSHIYRAGGAAERTGAFLRDREVLEHVRHCVARGLPPGGDPRKGPAAVTAALELADSAAMAYRIVGRSPSGTAAERDDIVGAFMRVTDNLDAAVRNLSTCVDSAGLRGRGPGLAVEWILNKSFETT